MPSKFALGRVNPLVSQFASILLNRAQAGQPAQALMNARASRLTRFDPTRTTMIVRKFEADLRRRITRLRDHIIEFIATLDALGLSPRPPLVLLAQARQFEFSTDAQKLQAFQDWFRQQVEADVLTPTEGSDWNAPYGSIATGPWSGVYVESAYKRGVINAYLASKRAKLAEELGVGDLSQEEFLRLAFNSPEMISKVQLLATRSFEELRGVTAEMGQQMNRILADAISQGLGAETVAQQMTESIEGIGYNRALTIARTELINAHAEGQLDSFERLGVKRLGLMAEWLTAGDNRVCPACSTKEGKVFAVEEARGLIPLHPNCRCSWIPYVKTES